MAMMASSNDSNLESYAVFGHDIHQLGFNFDRFPFTRLEIPVAACILYLLTVKGLYEFQSQKKDDRKVDKSQPQSMTTGKFIENVIISGHNIALCIFSALCFCNLWPIAYKLLQSPGWSAAICQDLFHDNETWWTWTYLFYLSKYYEFLDTYILIYKGRSPSFLQKFHHVGALFSMWIIVASKSHLAYVFVMPNSFIHSIMYLYYAASVWKIRVPCKWILTQMQMIQFVFGLFLGGVEVYHGECQNFADWMSITFNAVYVPSLLILFNMFYKKTYNKGSKQS